MCDMPDSKLSGDATKNKERKKREQGRKRLQINSDLVMIDDG